MKERHEAYLQVYEAHTFLLKIFKYLRSGLKPYQTSTLSVSDNLLPTLKELDLSDVGNKKGAQMDLNKFSNLKSLLMPKCRDDELLC